MANKPLTYATLKQGAEVEWWGIWLELANLWMTNGQGELVVYPSEGIAKAHAKQSGISRAVARRFE